MNSPQQKKCNQCLQKFTRLKNPYKMYGCKHNVCGQCLQQIKQSKLDTIQCQFCDNTCGKVTKKKFQPNRTLTLKLQKNLDFKDRNIDSSNFLNKTSRPNKELLEEENLMLLTEDQSNFNSKGIRTHIRKIQGRLCKQHEKQLEIICATDQQMICPHCAIFGNHKDHAFKTLKEFNKDFDIKSQKLQMIKQKKYLYDKKFKNTWSKEFINSSLVKKKNQIVKETEGKFNKIKEDIQALQHRLVTQLNQQFSKIQADMIAIFQQQNTHEINYFKWQSDSQNSFAAIDKTADPTQKIKLLYGSLKNIQQGSTYLDKFYQQLGIRNKKLQNLISSISIQFNNNYDFFNIASIVQKNVENQDNYQIMFENITEILKLNEDQSNKLNENSFITQFTKQTFPHMQKTPQKSFLHDQSIIYQTPPQKTFSKSNAELLRVRSTTHFNTQDYSVNKEEFSVSGEIHFKQHQKKDPSIIIKNFIQGNVKEILDLSHCQLNDETVLHHIKEVRKHRKIKTLKLCYNSITDTGFENIVEYLSTTTNLNLSHNKLTQSTISVLISKKDKLSLLRIVNLLSNNINDKKVKVKIDSLKKMGIAIIM